MTSVLVTGAGGQLGQCIQNIGRQFPSLNFFFADKNTLDITDINEVLNFFATHVLDWCINSAAYTGVDQAEIEHEKVFKINAMGAKNMAIACQKYHVKMVQISTDFVFDGLKTIPYTELDETIPQNVYGESKLKGENEITQILDEHFIIRTSWLYSEYGNNFMKTMLHLSKEKDELNIINDQFGTPTYAGDLAQIILQIIENNSKKYGTYHYSNEGFATWFDFAEAIFELRMTDVIVKPILTKDYISLAKRPKYSVLDTTKISLEMNLKIPHWKDSLKKIIHN